MVKQIIVIVAVFFILLTGVLKLAASDAFLLPLSDARLPNDSRLHIDEKLTIYGHLPFVPSKTPAEWNERAEYLRRQIKVGLGIWPMPTLTPLNAVIHGLIEFEDYTVEKVYFNSIPGHYVTGNLYRPKDGLHTARPAVLCPYGHWRDGRFYKTDAAEFIKYLKNGREHFDPSGRYLCIVKMTSLNKINDLYRY